MTEHNHTQPAIIVKPELKYGGHMMKVSMKSPAIVQFPGGHPFCQVTSDEFPDMLASLRGKMLPPDKGPYADNEKGELHKMAFQMAAAGKGRPDRLEAECEWLIDVLLPRGEITGAIGEKKKVDLWPIDDERSFGDLRLIEWNAAAGARPSYPFITSGSLLGQETIQIEGNVYMPVFYEEEAPLAGAGAIRARHEVDHTVQAYLSLLYCNDGLHNGIAVFPDDHTLLSFSNSRTHREVRAIGVLSDPMVMATQWLRRADQKLIRETDYVSRKIGLPPTIERDEKGRPIAHRIIDEEYVDITIAILRAMAAHASFHCLEHPELETFDQRFRGVRLDWKSALTAQRIQSRLMDLHKRLEAEGVAPQRPGGIPPANVEAYILKKIVEPLCFGYYTSGPDHPNMAECHAMVSGCIAALPRFGFPEERLPDLIARIDAKIEAIRGTETALRIEAADAAQGTNLLAEAYLKDLESGLGELRAALEASSISQVEAVRRVESITDKLGEGSRRCGLDHALIVNGKSQLEAFITKTLPTHEFPRRTVKALSTRLDDQFDPKSAVNMEHEAEQRKEEVFNRVARLVLRLASNPPPKMSEVVEVVKDIITNLATDAARFGHDNASMKAANQHIIDFVLKILPKHGVSDAALRDIKSFAREKLSPPAAPK